MKPLQQLYSFITLRLSDWNKNYLILAVFIVLIVLFYGNTLLNDGFVFDDVIQIENNPYVHSLQYLPKAVTSCQWEYSNKGCEGRTLYYRPTFFVSTILTWQISPNPWAFHLVNLLYFLFIVYLIFLVAKTITKDGRLSFIAALVFLIHPIHTETVNWIAASTELTAAMFILLTVLFYAKYRQSNRRRDLIFVYVFYFVTLLSKESGAVLPLVLLLMDILLFRRPIKQLIRWQELQKFLLFAVPLGIYLFMRVSVIGFSIGGGFIQLNFTERIYAMVTLFWQYIQSLFYPYPLSVFHTFEVSSNFLSLAFLISLIGGVAFFVLVAWLLWKQYYMPVFAVLWFLIFLSPVLIFLDSVGENVFSERYLFVPTIGFAFIVGWLLSFLWRRYHNSLGRQAQMVIWISFVSLLALGFWTTIYERNRDWKDNETISLKTLQQNPDAHPVRVQLGRWYLQQGEPDKGREQLEELIQRAPDWKDITMAYKGLGDYYRAQGDKDAAQFYYTRATQTSRSARDYVTFNDLGVLHMDKGEYLKGFAYFCQSLQLLPDNQTTLNNFDAAVAVIDTEYIQNDTLYEEVIEQFNEAPIGKIVFQDRRCTEDSCQYAFSLQSPDFEVLPPFLITAQTLSGENVEITNRGFNAETQVIFIEIPTTFEDETMTFVFPSCNGVYYEAVAAVEP